MSDETPNLTLPYLIASQAQKHVTHNEALQIIDALAMLVITATLTTPPSSPTEGDCYLVDSGATGDWAGKDGQIANWIDGSWTYYTPSEGWTAWFSAVDSLKAFNGTDWIAVQGLSSFSTLGINATADETNRLTVSSSATLLNNEGAGHQLKINKASESDTGSLLFQTNWSGRAEMGLAGGDDFAIKVSSDGASWFSAIQISGDGVLDLPQNPLARATLNGGTISPANGDETGFDRLAESRGGFTLGAATSSGVGNELTIPVAGKYLIALTASLQPSASFTLEARVNGGTTLLKISGNGASSAKQTYHATTIATLAAGDTITLLHDGNAAMVTGEGETELVLTYL